MGSAGGAYRRRACGFGGSRLLQRVRTSRVPEADSLGVKVNVIRDVVPDVCVPRRIPLRRAANVPVQAAVAGALPAAVLELSEVALEEADLVLVGGDGGVGRGALQIEVVHNVALVDADSALRDELGAAHVLAMPVRRAVNGELGTFGRH